MVTIAALAAISLFALLPRNVRQRSYDPVSGRMRDTTVRLVPIHLGLDLRGGTHLALEVDESKGRVADCADAIRRAERVVRTRINEFGTSEPVVQIAGDCRLIVEVPGQTDLARARAIVQRTAFLEFRLIDSQERFLQSIPEIDAALLRAGLSGPQRPQLNTELLAPAARDSDVQDRAVLAAYLTRGQVPGEFLVAAADL